MKAIIQNYKDGAVRLEEIPPPALSRGGVLVRTMASLVSAGTERTMVELGRKSLAGKAIERPDLVRRVLNKVKTDGIAATIQTVMSRLDAPMPLGYSSAGIVVEVGEGAEEFRPGDRVACAGAGYASHAEYVFIPRNLAVKLPDEVGFEEACYTTLGSIAMQGLRLAGPVFGERIGVIGLGLLGLLTIQMARSAGCKVLGMDIDGTKCRLAEQLGSDRAVSGDKEFLVAADDMTGGHGLDRVIITAATKSNGPVELAGEAVRDQGTVVAVGAVGLELPRKPYYEKEVNFRIARSYGPGRYDNEYEEKGHDYPYGYVRWTENRNMQAFVEMLAAGKVDVATLTTNTFAIENAVSAYELITGGQKEPYLGIVIKYPHDGPGIELKRIILSAPPVGKMESTIRAGMIGAGMFATGTLLPSMRKVSGIELMGVCTQTGKSAHHAGKKFGFSYATTDESEVFGDSDVNTIVITTRHSFHAAQTVRALRAGKNVFVEKPLCLNKEELQELEKAYTDASAQHAPVFMVGYNRRFSRLATEMKDFWAETNDPLSMQYRINAGYIPPDHWVHDPEEGGGRIIGEICHFIDLMIFLAGSLPVKIYASVLSNSGKYRNDNVNAIVEFENGSVGNITYLANGDRSIPKERLEVFGSGKVGLLDNFRSLSLASAGKLRTIKGRRGQDKGFVEEWVAFSNALKEGAGSPIGFDELKMTSLATFAIEESIRTGKAITLRP